MKRRAFCHLVAEAGSCRRRRMSLRWDSQLAMTVLHGSVAGTGDSLASAQQDGVCADRKSEVLAPQILRADKIATKTGNQKHRRSVGQRSATASVPDLISRSPHRGGLERHMRPQFSAVCRTISVGSERCRGLLCLWRIRHPWTIRWYRISSRHFRPALSL